VRLSRTEVPSGGRFWTLGSEATNPSAEGLVKAALLSNGEVKKVASLKEIADGYWAVEWLYFCR
jgi:hypothetical protein